MSKIAETLGRLMAKITIALTVKPIELTIATARGFTRELIKELSSRMLERTKRSAKIGEKR